MGNVLKRRVGQVKLAEKRLIGERAFKRILTEVHLGATDRMIGDCDTILTLVGSGGYARYSITV
jgi:hypothetical protein